MALLLAQYVNNNITYKVYEDALEVIIPGKPNIYINFQELNQDLSDWGEYILELTFYDYTIILVDKNYLGINEYHITIYDDANDEEEILDEDIPQVIFSHIAETFENFVELDLNRNNNGVLPIANYPNNGQRAERNIPANASNAVSYTNIVNGANMVNFHGEFGHGRFYTKNTFNQIQPHVYSGKKKNPFTQQNIEPGNIIRYTAKKAAALQGGRRRVRKTKKRRVSKKKTPRRR